MPTFRSLDQLAFCLLQSTPSDFSIISRSFSFSLKSVLQYRHRELDIVNSFLYSFWNLRVFPKGNKASNLLRKDVPVPSIPLKVSPVTRCVQTRFQNSPEPAKMQFMGFFPYILLYFY